MAAILHFWKTNTNQSGRPDSSPSEEKNAERNSSFSVFSFLTPKKTLTRGGRGERKVEWEKNREAQKAREGRKKYHWRAIIWAISGRLLFHPPVGTEGTGRVCLAAGWEKEGGIKRKKEKKEGVNKCMGRLELKTVEYREFSQTLLSLKGPVSKKTERKGGGREGGREGCR